jgi:hypothetical protein
MASTTSSTNAAVTPAVTSDWLTIDTTAAQAGFGPARPPGPDTSTAPVVPVGQSPLDPQQPVKVPASEGFQYEPEGVGPWPYVPDYGNAFDYQIQREQDGLPQGGLEALLPGNEFPGQWNSYNGNYAGYDALSQATDTAGWKQNVPTGRNASRNTFGQSNPDNNPTWYPFGVRPVQPHFAVTASDFTAGTVEGTPGITYGTLPDWSQTGGQGNTAYETPGPPPTTEPDSSGDGLIEMGWA